MAHFAVQVCEREMFSRGEARHGVAWPDVAVLGRARPGKARNPVPAGFVVRAHEREIVGVIVTGIAFGLVAGLV